MPHFPLVLALIAFFFGITARGHGLGPPSHRDGTLPVNISELAKNISKLTNSNPTGVNGQGFDPSRRYGTGGIPFWMNRVNKVAVSPTANENTQGGGNREEQPRGTDRNEPQETPHTGSADRGGSRDRTNEGAPYGPTNDRGSHTTERNRRTAYATEHAIYVFAGITEETKEPSPKTKEKDDICAFCLCKRDFSDIACLHSHNQGIGNHSLTLRQALLPTNATSLKVQGYETVLIDPKTFARPESLLKSITFQDIGRLDLKEESLFFSPDAPVNKRVVVSFNNCVIPIFPTKTLTQKIRGRHHNGNNFLFQRERTRYLTVHINRCQIGVLKEKSLWQARLMTLNITDTTIYQIEGEAIELDVADLGKFNRNSLPALGPHAICLHAKSTVFIGNHIKEVGGRSIAVETEGVVLFEHNTIDVLRAEALMEITPQSGHYGASITFVGNLLKEVEPDSLTLSPSLSRDKFKFSISNNTFELPCECNISLTLETVLGKASYMRDVYEDIVQGSRCRKELNDATPTISEFRSLDCKPFPVAIVSAVGAAFFLLIVTVIVCVVCSLRVHHVKEEANMLGDCASQSFSTLNRPYLFNDNTLPISCVEGGQLSPSPFGLPLPWGAAVPEVKTYQENETPDFTEQTESIRDSREYTLDSPRQNSGTRASCPLN